MFLVFILYKGIQEKHVKKLTFWVICQVVLLAFYCISAIIDIAEKQNMGSVSYIITLIILVYRCVAIKILYDAIQELRAYPVTVPFVQMRNCEDRV